MSKGTCPECGVGGGWHKNHCQGPGSPDRKETHPPLTMQAELFFDAYKAITEGIPQVWGCPCGRHRVEVVDADIHKLRLHTCPCGTRGGSFVYFGNKR